MDRTKTVSLIFPKRAFPDENALAWFRALANDRPEQAEKRSLDEVLATGNKPSDAVRVTFKLTFRDYVVLTLASRQTWIAVALFWSFFVGIWIYAAANPPPHPVNSNTKVLLFMIPFWSLATVVFVVVFAIRNWFLHRKNLTSQDWAFSESGIHFSDDHSSGSVPWTTYEHFKETKGSFILWHRKNRAWVLLPKRDFASPEDAQRCRWLIEGHLRRARWFPW